MKRHVPYALLLLLPLGCGTGDQERGGGVQTTPLPPVTHVPTDTHSRPADPLLGRRFAATDFHLGAHALLRDSAAWTRFWAGSPYDAPPVDFRTANVLARRVFDGASMRAAAPRVTSRAGLTFVVLPGNSGPARPTGRDSVAFYRIPVTGGPVRYVAYDPAA
jgi:hypothetical protein